MTAPSYTTDLTTLDDGETGSWYELTASGWDTGDDPGAEVDYFIQGSGCRSSDTNNKTGLCSGVYDAGSDQSGSFTSGVTCVFVWHVLLPGNAMNTNANDGIRVCVGSSLSAFRWWGVGGRDFGRNPYGGWQNFAVDPSASGTDVGGGHGGSYQYFGAAADVTSNINKGTMHGWDAVRYGRGKVIIEYGETANYGTFAGIATKNDANDATNGYNRWGLFQAIPGGYLWKGMLEFGNGTNPCDFRDSNRNIFIDEARHTYASFNKIEFRNTNSRVDWTGINITSLFPSGTAPGILECIDDIDLNIDTCTFTDFNTMKFKPTTTIVDSVFRRCGQVDQGVAASSAGADIDRCVFDQSDAAVALFVTNLNNIDYCDFISDGTGHAIELSIDHAGNSYTLTGCTFTGYAATNGSTGNECIYNNSGGAVTINVGTATIPTYMNGSGASTTISGSVDLYIIVKDIAGSPIQNVQTAVYKTSDRSEIINQDTDVNGEVDSSYSGSTPVGVEVRCRKASSGATKYKNYSSLQTIEATTGLRLAVTLIEDPNNNATS